MNHERRVEEVGKPKNDEFRLSQHFILVRSRHDLAPAICKEVHEETERANASEGGREHRCCAAQSTEQ